MTEYVFYKIDLEKKIGQGQNVWFSSARLYHRWTDFCGIF